MNSARPGAAGLTVEAVQAGYGTVPVLRDVNLVVRAGERVALIGANGAGKTTLLRTISGLIRPTAGRITLDDDDLGRVPPHRLARRGLAHVPEGRQVFARQTVLDNLRLGARGTGRTNGESRLDFVLDRLPQLRDRLRSRAADLSGGQQQMLALGRALMSAPRVLMVDELSLGLAPITADEIAETVAGLTTEHGMSLLVVEQNVAIALALTDRTYVMRNGAIVGDYPSTELAGNRELVLQYLGA
ncbi:MAG: ABC transporter ATP-binding protein [Actinomycetota bacterium]